MAVFCILFQSAKIRTFFDMGRIFVVRVVGGIELIEGCFFDIPPALRRTPFKRGRLARLAGGRIDLIDEIERGRGCALSGGGGVRRRRRGR